jgi:TatA/E family protein of Tat protein translocase
MNGGDLSYAEKSASQALDVILIVALLVFGRRRLPEIGCSLGKGMRAPPTR